MSNDPPPRKSQSDADLEREIRAERKFTLTEAIGRMAGPGSMKGASPVTAREFLRPTFRNCRYTTIAADRKWDADHRRRDLNVLFPQWSERLQRR